MSSKDFTPWWERPNDYLMFDERKEFVRGVTGYRPNNRQEVMFAMLSRGYVNDKFANPQSFTGKKRENP